MGKVYAELSDNLRRFIGEQRMFFVSTAPLDGDGHVNVSPKGLDSLRVLGPRQVAYIDYTGSGVETIAHVRENGRLTVMFCAFHGNPNIVRLYGKARVVEPQDGAFADLVSHFAPVMPVRSIIVLDVSRISDSCGFGVPRYAYEGDRDQLQRWVAKKDAEAIAAYQLETNSNSIDGLPGLRSTEK